jgi:anti-sigma regulatory factor (Ser/Thr protein kinase)
MGAAQVKAEHIRLVTNRESIAPAPLPRTALVVVQSPRLRRTVTRVLKALDIEIATASRAAEAQRWVKSVDPALLIYDCDSGGAKDSSELTRLMELHANTPVILLSEETEIPMLSQLLRHAVGYNLVAKNGAINEADLLVTARKLLDNNIFGIEKYLRWGCVIQTCTVRGTEDRAPAMARLENFTEELQLDPRYAATLATVGDEFLTNALYHAPMSAGEHPFSARSRREPVTLPSTKQASLEFGSDGRNIAIGCRDLYGSLAVSPLLEKLGRQVEAKLATVSDGPGGAGIGLYMVYRSVNHLVINLEPGQGTEFIAIVDVGLPHREQARRARSLNVFTLA